MVKSLNRLKPLKSRVNDKVIITNVFNPIICYFDERDNLYRDVYN